jgi:hypothetical protein
MKCFTLQRARDGTIGADQPQVESKLLGDRQSESVTPAGDQDHFNSFLIGPLQGFQVLLGYSELRVQQGTVNVDGNQANGRIHCRDFNSSGQ